MDEGTTAVHDHRGHDHSAHDQGHDHQGHNCKGHGHQGHSHAHGHAHGHAHHHGPASYDRRFAVGVALNLGFVAVEAVYGALSGSLALLADAGHNMSDVLGLLLAWAAAWAGRRRPTPRWTYGFGRSSILASLINAVVLLIATGAIAWEAIRRLSDPQPIEAGMVMWVAALGIAVNAGTAAMFMAGRERDLNIKGAFLHMAADAAVSLGVVIAAFAIARTGWLWIDPVTSLVIVVVIAVGTWGLLRDSVRLALDAVPADIDRQAVEGYLAGLPGVAAVHDLHIWPLSTTSVALTAHLVKPDASIDDDLLHGVAAELHRRFGIDHATIQTEHGSGGQECRLAAPHVV